MRVGDVSPFPPCLPPFYFRLIMGSSHERLDFYCDSFASRDAKGDVMFAGKILIILPKKLQSFIRDARSSLFIHLLKPDIAR